MKTELKRFDIYSNLYGDEYRKYDEAGEFYDAEEVNSELDRLRQENSSLTYSGRLSFDRAEKAVAEVNRLRNELERSLDEIEFLSSRLNYSAIRVETAEKEVERLKQENAVAWENSRTSRVIADALTEKAKSEAGE